MIGSTVEYGIDAPKFVFKYKAKVHVCVALNVLANLDT